MDTLKPKKSKSITFTVRGSFFTFWAILAHSEAFRHAQVIKLAVRMASASWPGQGPFKIWKEHSNRPL